MNLRTYMAIVMIVAGAFGIACSDDGGNTTDNAVDNAVVDNATTDVAADTQVDNSTTDVVVDTPVTTSLFEGQLVDFASKTGRKGVDVMPLDNDTGLPLDAVKYPALKSGDDGLFEMQLPAGTMVGFQATGKEEVTTGIAMKFQKTYMFNIPSDAQGKRVYAVNTITYATAPATAGIKVDKTKGILAGTIYWKNGVSGQEEFVGCASIEAIPVEGTTALGDVRYFDPANDLPGPLSKAPFTTTGLAGTSRYIIANLPVGRYKLVVKINDVQVNTGAAEVSLFAYADSIAISNVYLEGAANPTPARAECVVDEANPT